MADEKSGSFLFASVETPAADVLQPHLNSSTTAGANSKRDHENKEEGGTGGARGRLYSSYSSATGSLLSSVSSLDDYWVEERSDLEDADQTMLNSTLVQRDFYGVRARAQSADPMTLMDDANNLRELITKQQRSSSFSHQSVSGLLLQRNDPEELLLDLGFGGSTELDVKPKIPERFFYQDSLARGVSVEKFIEENLEEGYGAYRTMFKSLATRVKTVGTVMRHFRKAATLANLYSEKAEKNSGQPRANGHGDGSSPGPPPLGRSTSEIDFKLKKNMKVLQRMRRLTVEETDEDDDSGDPGVRRDYGRGGRQDTILEGDGEQEAVAQNGDGRETACTGGLRSDGDGQGAVLRDGDSRETALGDGGGAQESPSRNREGGESPSRDEDGRSEDGQDTVFYPSPPQLTGDWASLAAATAGPRRKVGLGSPGVSDGAHSTAANGNGGSEVRVGVGDSHLSPNPACTFGDGGGGSEVRVEAGGGGEDRLLLLGADWSTETDNSGDTLVSSPRPDLTLSTEDHDEASGQVALPLNGHHLARVSSGLLSNSCHALSAFDDAGKDDQRRQDGDLRPGSSSASSIDQTSDENACDGNRACQNGEHPVQAPSWTYNTDTCNGGELASPTLNGGGLASPTLDGRGGLASPTLDFGQPSCNRPDLTDSSDSSLADSGVVQVGGGNSGVAVGSSNPTPPPLPPEALAGPAISLQTDDRQATVGGQPAAARPVVVETGQQTPDGSVDIVAGDWQSGNKPVMADITDDDDGKWPGPASSRASGAEANWPKDGTISRATLTKQNIRVKLGILSRGNSAQSDSSGFAEETDNGAGARDSSPVECFQATLEEAHQASLVWLPSLPPPLSKLAGDDGLCDSSSGSEVSAASFRVVAASPDTASSLPNVDSGSLLLPEEPAFSHSTPLSLNGEPSSPPALPVAENMLAGVIDGPEETVGGANYECSEEVEVNREKVAGRGEEEAEVARQLVHYPDLGRLSSLIYQASTEVPPMLSKTLPLDSQRESKLQDAIAEVQLIRQGLRSYRNELDRLEALAETCCSLLEDDLTHGEKEEVESLREVRGQVWRETLEMDGLLISKEQFLHALLLADQAGGTDHRPHQADPDKMDCVRKMSDLLQEQFLLVRKLKWLWLSPERELSLLVPWLSACSSSDHHHPGLDSAQAFDSSPNSLSHLKASLMEELRAELEQEISTMKSQLQEKDKELGELRTQMLETHYQSL